MRQAPAHPNDHTEVYLWAFRFADGAARPLARGPLPDGLATETGWVWAHFALSDQRARAFLARLGELPPEARDALLGEDDNVRILFGSAWTYGALPDFESDFDGRITGFGRMRFAFDGKRLVTTRRHSLHVLNEVRRLIDCGDAGFPSPSDAVFAISRCYCDLAEDHIDALAAQLDTIEDRVLADEGELPRFKLGPLRRDLSQRHREVAALRTAYHRAATRHGVGHDHAFLGALPRLQQRAEDVNHEIAALQDRARLVHEEIDTKINSATNRALHALTVMTALLMPPTLVAGIFGMNLRGIAFGDSAQGFAVVSGLCVATVAGAYALLRLFNLWK